MTNDQEDFDPIVVLNAAIARPEGVTLNFTGPDPGEDRRKLQQRLSAERKAAQKKLALAVRVWEDMRKTTGWELVRTKSIGERQLWVGVQSRDSFGVGRINGMNGAER